MQAQILPETMLNALAASQWKTKFANLILNFSHPDPNNPQHSPYKHIPIQYGAKIEYTNENPDSPNINDDGILCVRSIL